MTHDSIIQVAIDLGGVHHDELSALRGECGLNVLRSEPAETVPVPGHDPVHRPITRQSEELALQQTTDNYQSLNPQQLAAPRQEHTAYR